MRKLALLVFLFIVAIGSMPAIAQTDAELDELIASVRADIKRDRVTIIGDAMGFTADEASKFWPIYKEYEAEFTKIGDTLLALIKDYAANLEKLSAEKATQLTNQTMRFQQLRLDLRKKYSDRLAKEMSPIIAARFMQVDNRISLLIDLELASGVPLIPTAK
jgi:hypothetical protein